MGPVFHNLDSVNTDETKAELPQMSPAFRRALPWWLQGTLLLVVFGAGSVTGAILTARSIHAQMNAYRENAPLFADDISMRLRFRLSLSEDQTNDVRRIVGQRHSKMVEHRNDGSRRMHAEFDSMVGEIASVLDDRQMQHWNAIAEQVKQTYLPKLPDAD